MNQDDERSQSDRFAEAAKRLGADVDEETLKRALKKVARHKTDSKIRDKEEKSDKSR